MTHNHNPVPLSRLWLRGIVVQAMCGELHTHGAQQLVAYYVWKNRAYGDALGDWLEAARLLNATALESDLDAEEW